MGTHREPVQYSRDSENPSRAYSGKASTKTRASTRNICPNVVAGARIETVEIGAENNEMSTRYMNCKVALPSDDRCMCRLNREIGW